MSECNFFLEVKLTIVNVPIFLVCNPVRLQLIFKPFLFYFSQLSFVGLHLHVVPRVLRPKADFLFSEGCQSVQCACEFIV